MERSNPWTLLCGGTAEQEKGLELIQRGYAQHKDGSHVTELGIALLWLRRYLLAWQVFRKAMDECAVKGDVFYGMAGVAKWCLGEYEGAVSEWVQGLKSKYARGAGLGVKMPLLLYFASVVKPEVYDNEGAIKLLLEKAKDRRIKSWPGPIAQGVVLGQIDEVEFSARCRGRHERDFLNGLWQANFYKNLKDFKKSEFQAYKNAMEKLSNVRQVEWRDERILLERLWNEEFFLARYEAGEG